MIFTWDWRNTCIVFLWWHVQTFPGFLASNIAIILMSMGYEALKYQIAVSAAKRHDSPDMATFRHRHSEILDSVEYAIQVGYSFLIMLVFMTYNGWYMLSVAVGAGLGYFVWGSKTPGNSLARSLSCH